MSDSSVDTTIVEKSTLNSPTQFIPNPFPPSTQQKSIKQSLIVLVFILLGTFIAFIIFQSTKKLKNNEKIIFIERENNTQLMVELKILRSRGNQTQQDLIDE